MVLIKKTHNHVLTTILCLDFLDILDSLFLFLYGTPQKGLLYLDQCTRELGVERRRIYDIINILESFSVIRRCAKNEYKWRGIDKIIYSIEQQITVCVSASFHYNYARRPPKSLVN